MNWGRLLSFTMIALSFAAAAGYLLAGEHRRALYFFFGGCISLTVAA